MEKNKNTNYRTIRLYTVATPDGQLLTLDDESFKKYSGSICIDFSKKLEQQRTEKFRENYKKGKINVNNKSKK